MRDPNLDQLITAAVALRPLLPELVFVGGCVTGLLITDEAAGEPRATVDVDAIAEITSYAEYAKFCDRLHSLGFHEDTSAVTNLLATPGFIDALPVKPGSPRRAQRGWIPVALHSDIISVS